MNCKLRKTMYQKLIEKYLIEAKNPLSDIENKNILNIFQKIKENCSEILKLYRKTGRVFWRGTNHYVTLKKFKPRKNRKPYDMSIFFQKLLNKKFNEKFGWNPRSEGVFATQSKDITGMYGTPNIFLPFDGFEYLWSPKTQDLYIYINDLNADDNPWSSPAEWNENDVKKAEKKNPKIMEKFYKKIDKIVETYTNKNLVDALQNKSKSEIMFKCDYYYLLSYDKSEYSGIDPVKILTNKF